MLFAVTSLGSAEPDLCRPAMVASKFASRDLPLEGMNGSEKALCSTGVSPVYCPGSASEVLVVFGINFDEFSCVQYI